MLTFLLQTLGWLMARAPEWLLRVLTAVLGEAVLWLAPRRRHLIRSNLHHAFPLRPAAWHARTARACCRRLVETSLLSLATPYLKERRIRRMVRFSPGVEAWVRDFYARPRPIVLGTLHLALWEAQTWFKLFYPSPQPEIGVIFRPLDPPAVDAYVKRTRERFGLRLLSRREGFAHALGILRRNGWVGVLFDQNAGLQGALTLLFGRVCSTTELPGVLAAKLGAEVRTFHPRRTGFWRVTFESDPIAHDGTATGVTLALNQWLETALSTDSLCESWLWAHDRWRHQDVPSQRLRLESKRNLLAADLRARGLPSLPRNTRFWIRMPNWLGDVMMVLPLLRALRASRPDAEITLLAKKTFLPLLDGWGLADRLHPLPDKGGAGYFRHFWRWRGAYPDVWLNFTQSFRGDAEAWLTGCPQRFGIVRHGKRRPFLSHAYRVPDDFDESRHHQLELWENFFRHFGLMLPLDLAPLPSSDGAGRADGPIGLIPGSENNPEKRWSAGHWRRLIADLPDERFVLFGTAGDAPITAAIAAGASPDRVEDLAGKTNLTTYGKRLRGCRLLVTNDTGGMHLANALGVPLIALFGPTNPRRTGPVFSAPCQILQPPGCPATGGGRLADLAPETVVSAVKTFKERIPNLEFRVSS